MLTCPFCNETDFDELGLEIHLANYCMGDQSPKSNSLAFNKGELKMNVENVRIILERTFGFCVLESDAQIVLDEINKIVFKDAPETLTDMPRPWSEGDMQKDITQ